MEKFLGVSYPTIKNRLNRIGAPSPFAEIDPDREPFARRVVPPRRASVELLSQLSARHDERRGRSIRQPAGLEGGDVTRRPTTRGAPTCRRTPKITVVAKPSGDQRLGRPAGRDLRDTATDESVRWIRDQHPETGHGGDGHKAKTVTLLSACRSPSPARAAVSRLIGAVRRRRRRGG
jgi:hypothetical protein